MSEEIAKQETLKIEDPEFAATELARFASNCGIKLTKPDKSTNKEDTNFYLRVRQYVMTGELVINEDGTGTYKLKKPVPSLKEVIFDEPDAGIMRALDRLEKDGSFTGMQAFIAGFAKRDMAIVSKIKKRDLDPLTDIATLFLG